MLNGQALSTQNCNTPTVNTDLEREVVGSLIHCDIARPEILDIIREEMILTPSLQNAFAVCKEIYLSGGDMTPAVIVVGMVKRGMDEKHAVETVVNVMEAALGLYGAGVDAAREVANRHLALMVRRACTDILTEIETKKSIDISFVYEAIAGIETPNDRENHLWTMPELLMDFDVSLPKKTMQERGIPKFGIGKIDQTMAIFKPGNFTVLAGKPGGGKSTLMRQAALSASECGEVIIFSLEETKEQMRDKMSCAIAGVSYDTWNRGLANIDEEGRIAEAAIRLSCKSIRISTGSTDATRVKLAVKKLKASGKKISAVMIDTLNVMGHPKMDNRYQAVGETTRLLRLMALDLEVPILLLCQMNRNIDQRGNNASPRLSDLRDSGDIEANASNVLFLWKRDIDDIMDNSIVLTVAKHRDGRVGQTDLVFVHDRGRIEMAAHEEAKV